MKPFAIAILLLISYPSFSGNYPITYDNSEEILSSSEVSQIKKIVDKVNTIIDPLDTHKMPLTVKFLQNSSRSEYTPGAHIIIVAKNYTRYFGEEAISKSFNGSLPIIAHEYGHYIFDMYMSQNNPDWKKLSKKYAHLAHLKDEVEKQIILARLESKKISEQMELAKTEIEFNELLNKSKEVRQKCLDLLDKQMEVYSELSSMSLFHQSIAYTELFADIIAVIVFKQGNVINQLLSFPAHPYEYRDFTRNTLAEGWDQEEDHTLFDPVRSFLWKNYLEKNISANNSASFLRVVLDSIQKEMQEREKDVSLLELHPETLNQRLIDKLQVNLKSF